MTDTLLPCPFCGGEPEQDFARSFRWLQSGKLDHGAAIYCTACNADMIMCRGDHPELSDEERMAIMVENWNRRVPPPQSHVVPDADAKALKAVEAIFADLRDRRFLKWLFDRNGDANLIGRFDNGEELRGIDLDAQGQIKAAWQVIIAKALATTEGWNDPATAPKDGTVLHLLVRPGQEDLDPLTSFHDSRDPYETIGFNQLTDTGEDVWQFAGWDWCHDRITEGDGEVIGWRPFVVDAKVEPQPWKKHESFAFDLDDEMIDRMDALAGSCAKQGIGILATANYHGQGRVHVPAAWLQQLIAGYRANHPPETRAKP